MLRPRDWPEEAMAPFKDVLNDPVAWAKKCINDYGAEMICLQLVSTDPNDADRSAEEAARTVKNVAEACRCAADRLGNRKPRKGHRGAAHGR